MDKEEENKREKENCLHSSNINVHGCIYIYIYYVMLCFAFLKIWY